MVAFKGSDVEISNYITKLSHEEETRVADRTSQAHSKDISDPTYHAEATDQNVAQDVSKFEFKIGNMKSKLDEIRSSENTKSIDRQTFLENVQKLDQEMMEQAQREMDKRKSEQRAGV